MLINSKQIKQEYIKRADKVWRKIAICSDIHSLLSLLKYAWIIKSNWRSIRLCRGPDKITLSFCLFITQSYMKDTIRKHLRLLRGMHISFLYNVGKNFDLNLSGPLVARLLFHLWNNKGIQPQQKRIFSNLVGSALKAR